MASVRLASSTALAVIFDDCATCRLISPMEAVSSSAAEATVCKPVLASSAAEATAAACWLLWSAVPVIDCAVASNSVELADSIPTRRPTLLSNPSAIRCRAAFCSAAA